MGVVAEVQAGDLVFGKYCVERALGTGGMGSVFAAVHVQLEQRVALKILDGEVAKEPEIRERFLREARIAAKLQSEHAARVLDIGILDNGLHCIVMEYLEGEDLATVLADKGPLDVPVALGYLLSACEALAEAHAHGVVHRDLKPSNLFLTRRADGSRLIKIIDFGIAGFDAQIAAEAADKPLTRTRSLVGTPSYMSPEQLASAREVDARSDIWALGVTLFELLTGARPFAKGSLPEICASILKDEPKQLTDERSDLPKDLGKVITRCLEKDRENRYRDLSELAAALLPYAPYESERSLERIRAVLTRLNRPAEVAPESARVIQAHQVTQAATRREDVTPSGTRAPSPSQPELSSSHWDLDLRMPPPKQLSEEPPTKRGKRPTLRREEPEEAATPPTPSPSPPAALARDEDRRKRPSIRREEPEDDERLGDHSKVPRLAVDRSALTQMDLDPRAGFLLSRIDGISTIQEILDMSGMEASETLEILARLLDQRVIAV